MALLPINVDNGIDEWPYGRPLGPLPSEDSYAFIEYRDPGVQVAFRAHGGVTKGKVSLMIVAIHRVQASQQRYGTLTRRVDDGAAAGPSPDKSALQ